MHKPRALGAFLLFLLVSIRLEAVVISEIHYNAPAGGDLLEFVEVYNETTTPEDISGWEFVEGITFKFPPATLLLGRSSIVIAANEDAFRAVHEIDNVLGNYQGLLDAGGEQLTLVNQVGVVIQSIAYDDDGKWTVGPDGTGYTLSLANPYRDPAEPESWISSSQIGGTPGVPTYPDFHPLARSPVVAAAAVWRYREGTGPFADGQEDWRQNDFDDASWNEGATPIGIGYGDEATALENLPGNYTSVAMRIEFELGDGDIESPRDLFLSIEFDDGFCAWLNGEEFAQHGCGPDADWNSTATTPRQATGDDRELLFPLPGHLLRAGTDDADKNVISILGLNDTLEGDRFRLSPKVIRLRRPEGRAAPGPGVVFNELFQSAAPGAGWVEITNAGSWVIDLEGYHLTDDADRLATGGTAPFTFPADSVLAPGDFLVVNESATAIDFAPDRMRLFLVRPDSTVVAAHVFRRTPPPGTMAGTYAEASFPDGAPATPALAGRSWLTSTPTPGAPNQIERQEDLIVNEIFYHPPDDPPGEPRSEFVELYNRGTTAIDLSGLSFDRGITFTFDTGSIGPGEYVVLAADPALLVEHHGLAGGSVQVFGPYLGTLANSGENIRFIDALGNLIDEVRYSDSGEWSRWADGRGASLELIDPSQDNDFGAAWDVSDDSEKSEWQEFTYHVPFHEPSTSASEFHLFLLQKGICLIDDISLTRSGGENLIRNAGFEDESTSPWVIEGTHIASRRMTSDKHSGNACLEVVATARGNNRVNRLEIDTSPRMTEGPYDVALWARWQRGTGVIITHSDFTPPGSRDPLGNTLGARLRMTVPVNLGTPGAENSVRRKLREETGSDNLGPVIRGVLHSPAAPATSEPISFVAHVSDSNGVAQVQVVYRVDVAEAELQTQTLFDDGLHGDGAPGDGFYRALISGFPSTTQFVFYIEATDALGNINRSPRNAPADPHIVLVRTPISQTRDSARILLDSAHTTELQRRQIHSNDLLHGTFVFNDSEVYYNIGCRNRGSPWGRRPGNYRVRFPGDGRFIRGMKEVNLATRSLDGGLDEAALYFAIGRAGTHAHRAPVPHYFYVNGSVNSIGFGTQAAFEAVNGDFADRWYGEDGADRIHKADGRQSFNDRGGLDTQYWASLSYFGEHSESYRLYWGQKVRQTQDDWQPFMDLCRVMTAQQTPTAEFDAVIDDVLDVEQFFRVDAARVIVGDADGLFVKIGHNGYMVRDSNTGLWTLLAFDMDGRFTVGTNLFADGGDQGVARLFSRPKIRRTYFRVLSEYLSGYWSVEKMQPWLTALTDSVGVGTDDITRSLELTTRTVQNKLDEVASPFRIILASTEPVIEVGATWSFRPGTGPFSDPPTAWREPDHDDTAWETGPTPFGYGDLMVGTVLSDMRGNYSTVALRKKFNVSEDDLDRDYVLFVAYDDGFCAYLNGQEIGRENCGDPGEDVPHNDTASGATEVSTSEAELAIPRDALVVGENVIALMGLNVTLHGPDFGIIPRLSILLPAIITESTTVRLMGEAPVEIATMEIRINGEEPQPFTPTWDTVTSWHADFNLDRGTTTFEILAFDSDGFFVDSASVDVISTTFAAPFRRGEVNNDDRVNLTDALLILRFMFLGGSLTCQDAADVDDDGELTVADPTRLLFYLFGEAQQPPAPFATPGPDPTDDALNCDRP